MDLFLNERSLHGQFASEQGVSEALSRVMLLRKLALCHGRSIRVAAGLRDRAATAELSLLEFVRRTKDINLKRAVLSWVDRDGPFLESDPLAQPNDEVTFAGCSVAGSSIAETACRVALGETVALAGFSPSDFDAHPLNVELHDLGNVTPVAIENYWNREALEERLRALEPPIRSWADLDRVARRDFPELTLADDAMRLHNHPFNPGVADRIRKLLGMLAAMRRSILSDGTHGTEWNDLWERWFRGGELFSDSSDSEKREFEEQLTFAHPGKPGAQLRCPWHGKVNSPKYRVHFSYPIIHDEPVYVVYIGPKITAR